MTLRQLLLRITCAALILLATGCDTNPVQDDLDDAAMTTLAPPTTALPINQATGLVVLTADDCETCEEAIGILTVLAGEDSVHVYEATTGFDELPTVFLVNQETERIARWSGRDVLDLADEIITAGCRVHPQVCPGWTRGEPPGPVP